MPAPKRPNTAEATRKAARAKVNFARSTLGAVNVDDLITWLRARLDEDAQNDDVHDGLCASIPVHHDEVETYDGLGPQPCDCGLPERWQAEIDAKRQVIEQAADADRAYRSELRAGRVDPATVAVRTALVSAVASLAVPYAGGEGYDETWRP